MGSETVPDPGQEGGGVEEVGREAQRERGARW